MSNAPENMFVLTHEYYDKSGFKVCGVTRSGAIASAWLAAGDGQHKVYRVASDVVKNYSQGWEEWK